MPIKTGVYKTVADERGSYEAFIPHPLPPAQPLLSGERNHLLQQAENSLARLQLAVSIVPSPHVFVYSFIRKEAVISSQIEGTQATLPDLITATADTLPKEQDADIEEVCNYVRAVEFCLAEMQKDGGLPISTRLLCGAHRHLMQGVRGQSKMPGELRRSQNWVGGSSPQNARYVPPPPEHLPQLLSDLEKYVHGKDELPLLVRVGLLHVQFESIHPFVDGNGRVGRLLIALLLKHWGLLSEPLLYMSLFFKRQRLEYYDRLNAVRTEGDWDGWLSYFLRGVVETADEAVHCAGEITKLLAHDRIKIINFPKSTLTTLKLFELFPKHPAMTVARAAQLLATTRQTAHSTINILRQLGIVDEITAKQRSRIFCYTAYVDLLKKED
ncbi:MAG: Fic family protein [Pseudomonadota bacterium]|nr:Fic family protein [Pseudomonadota bacterium]